MTLEEIHKAIQEGGHKPSDLFPMATLTSDPYVKEHVEEKINNAKGYDIRKRQDLETRSRRSRRRKRPFRASWRLRRPASSRPRLGRRSTRS